MRTLFTFLMVIGLTVLSHGQQITMHKSFGGVRFERDTVAISIKQVASLLEEEPLAYDQFKKARVNSVAASVLGFAGGLLVGIPLGTALVGGDPEWGLALGGAALIGISIPLDKAFKRHAQSALDVYNQKLTSQHMIKPEVFFTANGVGLKIKF